ncbi:uncharacterized protein LOC124950945 isoform X2 [Vespa velutina]|uniref:uncharacterized protein LOC124950945 isoform X2 n=1 Tax=Vespa velutina TaxID=202808 RepID=UPI001FB50195|nr:uncharacterized protein LOC124950945 isoform X2 [Vespa velutina]
MSSSTLKDFSVQEMVGRKIQQEYYELLPDWNKYDVEDLNILRQYIGYAVGYFNNEWELDNSGNVESESNSVMDNHCSGNEEQKSVKCDGEMECRREMVSSIYDQIIKYGRESDGSIFCGVIYNVIYEMPKKDKPINYDTVMQLPIFKIRNHDNLSKEYNIQYIDNDGRLYENWDDYLTSNKLFECIMVVPKNGYYEADLDFAITEENSTVLVAVYLSPACSKNAEIVKYIDNTFSLLSVGTLGVTAVSLFTPVAPLALLAGSTATICGGIWMTGRSIYNLVDRNSHKQSISPTDKNALSSWIAVAGSTMGMAMSSGGMIISKAAQAGKSIGLVSKAAYNTAVIGNISINLAGIGFNGYCIVKKYQEGHKVDMIDALSFVMHAMFFANTILNIQFAHDIIDSSHGKVLEEYESTLRNKRHRKAYNKVKNKAQSKEEIVRYIKKVKSKAELFSSKSGSQATGSKPSDGQPSGSRVDGNEANGSKPSDGRPSGSRANGSKPNGKKSSGSQTSGSRPNGNEANDSKPNGSKPSDGRPSGSRANGSKPNGKKSSGSQTSGSRPNGNEANDSKPNGSKPSDGRPSGSRANGSKPNGKKSSGSQTSGSRPNGNEANDSKPNGSKTSDGQPSGSRANGSKLNVSEPNGSKTSDGQPSGSQPNGNKPSGSQPNGNKPSGSKASGSKPSGSQSNGNETNDGNKSVQGTNVEEKSIDKTISKIKDNIRINGDTIKMLAKEIKIEGGKIYIANFIILNPIVFINNLKKPNMKFSEAFLASIDVSVTPLCDQILRLLASHCNNYPLVTKLNAIPEFKMLLVEMQYIDDPEKLLEKIFFLSVKMLIKHFQGSNQPISNEKLFEIAYVLWRYGKAHAKGKLRERDNEKMMSEIMSILYDVMLDYYDTLAPTFLHALRIYWENSASTVIYKDNTRLSY